MHSANHRAFERIREQLATGELKAGDRVFEVDIARALGVSRTPVREARRRLAREGMLIDRRRRGTFVAPMSEGRVGDALDVRLALETLAIRRICRNREDLHSANEAVQQLWQAVASGDADDAMRWELRVHQAIVDLARNEPLRSSFAASIAELSLCAYGASKRRDAIAAFARDHDGVMEAIALGDADGAVEAMRRHLMAAANHAIAPLGKGASACAVSSDCF